MIFLPLRGMKLQISFFGSFLSWTLYRCFICIVTKKTYIIVVIIVVLIFYDTSRYWDSTHKEIHESKGWYSTHLRECSFRFLFRLFSLMNFVSLLCIIDAAMSSGILKAKQKLGVTFNSDKLGGFDFTKFSKLSMCSASAGRCWLVQWPGLPPRHCTLSVLKFL